MPGGAVGGDASVGHTTRGCIESVPVPITVNVRSSVGCGPSCTTSSVLPVAPLTIAAL